MSGVNWYVFFYFGQVFIFMGDYFGVEVVFNKVFGMSGVDFKLVNSVIGFVYEKQKKYVDVICVYNVVGNFGVVVCVQENEKISQENVEVDCVNVEIDVFKCEQEEFKCQMEVLFGSELFLC